MIRTESDWNRLYKKYLKSGQSVAGFAKSENLALSTTSAHFRKLADKKCKDFTVKTEPNPPVELVPVQILKNKIPEKLSSSDLVIAVSCFELHIGADTDKELLKDVLVMVRDIC